MFQAFILGAAITAGLLLAGRWYATADTKTLLKVIKWTLLGFIITVILFFILSGRLAWAFAAVPAFLPWFFRLRSVARAAKTFSRMRYAHGMRAGAQRGANSSNLETEYLRMKLDHDTGLMSGEVLAGSFSGRRLDDMTLIELVRLWQECDRDDPESSRVLAAYLDRHHPNWRGTEEEGPGNSTSSGSASASMGRVQALKILGLGEKATPADIKEAHRRLISGMHPDHGGSDYLAAQINRAKDTLLGE